MYEELKLTCPNHLTPMHVMACPICNPPKNFAERILQAHTLLIEIARDLRAANDFDHAQDMSDAALRCRAAYNELKDKGNGR